MMFQAHEAAKAVERAVEDHIQETQMSQLPDPNQTRTEFIKVEDIAEYLALSNDIPFKVCEWEYKEYTKELKLKRRKEHCIDTWAFDSKQLKDAIHKHLMDREGWEVKSFRPKMDRRTFGDLMNVAETTISERDKIKEKYQKEKHTLVVTLEPNLPVKTDNSKAPTTPPSKRYGLDVGLNVLFATTLIGYLSLLIYSLSIFDVSGIVWSFLGFQASFIGIRLLTPGSA